MNNLYKSSIHILVKRINDNCKQPVCVKFIKRGASSYYEVFIDGVVRFSGTKDGDPDLERLHWFISGMWTALENLTWEHPKVKDETKRTSPPDLYWGK